MSMEAKKTSSMKAPVATSYDYDHSHDHDPGEQFDLEGNAVLPSLSFEVRDLSLSEAVVSGKEGDDDDSDNGHDLSLTDLPTGILGRVLNFLRPGENGAIGLLTTCKHFSLHGGHIDWKFYFNHVCWWYLSSGNFHYPRKKFAALQKRFGVDFVQFIWAKSQDESQQFQRFWWLSCFLFLRQAVDADDVSSVQFLVQQSELGPEDFFGTLGSAIRNGRHEIAEILKNDVRVQKNIVKCRGVPHRPCADVDGIGVYQCRGRFNNSTTSSSRIAEHRKLMFCMDCAGSRFCSVCNLFCCDDTALHGERMRTCWTCNRLVCEHNLEILLFSRTRTRCLRKCGGPDCPKVQCKNCARDDEKRWSHGGKWSLAQDGYSFFCPECFASESH